MIIWAVLILHTSNIDIMARKKQKKTEEEQLELEHDEAKEQHHQAELEEGYEQDEKFEESED